MQCEPERFVMIDKPKEFMDRDQLIALAFLRSIYHDTHVIGKGFLASWDGPWRSGKSMTAITWSWLLDKSFKDDFENRIIHNPDDFVEYIAKADKLFTYKNLIGTACVIDEAGNTMASHEWHSRWSITINKVLQSMGYLKPMLNFVAPVKDNVNSGIRKLTNYHFTVKRNNKEYALIKPYQMQYNSLAGKTFPRFPRMQFFGERLIIHKIRQHGIPTDIMEAYQKLEIERKQKMLSDNISGLREKEDVKEENMDRDKLVAQVVDNYTFYLAKQGKTLDLDLIKFNLGISTRFAKFIQRLSENKLAELNKIDKEVTEIKGMAQYRTRTNTNLFTEKVKKRKIDGNILTATADSFNLNLDEE